MVHSSSHFHLLHCCVCGDCCHRCTVCGTWSIFIHPRAETKQNCHAVGLPAVQAEPSPSNGTADPQTTFFSGLAAYLQARKFGSGDTDILWETLENVTGVDHLANKMSTWTHQQGVPLLEASLTGTILNLRQRQLRVAGEEPLDCSGSGTFSSALPLPGPGDANTLGGAMIFLSGYCRKATVSRARVHSAFRVQSQGTSWLCAHLCCPR
jgi:hypothetical protein